MKTKTYGIYFDGGEQDGKTVDGLYNPVLIPNYKQTLERRDGRIVFKYEPAVLPG